MVDKQDQNYFYDDEDESAENEAPKNKNGQQKLTKFDILRDTLDKETFTKWDNEQKYVRSLIKEKDDFNWQITDTKADTFLKYIGGMDISFSKDDNQLACSYFVVMQYPDFKILYQDYEYVRLDMQYIPGFLAFRELAHLQKLFNKLKQTKPEILPQLLLIDGNGVLHPNACGLASHLGVLLDVPTIGCGKTVFYIDGLTKDIVYSEFSSNVQNAGDYHKLIGQSGRIWGAALKSTKQTKDPLIVSIGHKISLETACQIIKKCCKFFVPEPIRYADKQSRDLIKKIKFENIQNAVQNKFIFLIDTFLINQNPNQQQKLQDELEQKITEQKIEDEKQN